MLGSGKEGAVTDAWEVAFVGLEEYRLLSSRKTRFLSKSFIYELNNSCLFELQVLSNIKMKIK